MVKQLYYSEIHSKNIEIYLSKLYTGKYSEVNDVINLHRNNIFVNRTRLPLLCENSGAILLALVGLTAAWQAGSPAGRQSDKIRED